MIRNFQDKTPDVKRAGYIAENATVIGNVTLEENASIWFGAVIRAEQGIIKVGKNTNIQDNSVVHVNAGGTTDIGNDVTIGHGCILHGCTIGDGSLVGMGAIVLDGAVIGKNCIVGAGALVTSGKVFPDNVMILGSPAKAVKPVTEEQKKMNADAAGTYVEEAMIFAKTKSNV